MLEVIENCCDTTYLDMLKYAAQESNGWNLTYPLGYSFEDKHLKLTLVENEPVNELIAGMAMGLLIQIYNSKTESGVPASDFFYPEVLYCGISVKDKNRLDNPHTDHEDNSGIIKILGLLNSNWNKKDGGAFIHGDETVHLKPTNFVIFDPRIIHHADKITTHEKRLGIDFTVKRKNNV